MDKVADRLSAFIAEGITFKPPGCLSAMTCSNPNNPQHPAQRITQSTPPAPIKRLNPGRILVPTVSYEIQLTGSRISRALKALVARCAFILGLVNLLGLSFWGGVFQEGTNWTQPVNQVGHVQYWTSLVGIFLSLFVLWKLDKQRGIAGLIGSGIVFFVVVTARTSMA